MIDLNNLLERKQLIKSLKSMENIERKNQSLKDYEIYNDRLLYFVREQLISELGERTVAEMPVVAVLNIAKRIVKSQATIYSHDPKRAIEGASEKDIEVVESLYCDSSFNTQLQKANVYFKLRGQTFVHVYPKDGTIKLRVLQGHHIDVIPRDDDPEKAFAYIISSYDKSKYIRADGVNQTIADTEDYKASLERYHVITDMIDFIMDGRGNIVSEIVNHNLGMLPIVDIAKDKDFEFYTRLGQALSDFTILYNAAWSDQLYTKRFQGHAIGVLKGDSNKMPESISTGPAKLLFLPTDPKNPNSTLDLSFVSPDAKLEESQNVIKNLLADFLMTLGVDSKKVSNALNGSTSYSSAIERLLAMIDEFEATREDFGMFEKAEKEIFEIVKRLLVNLTGSQFLLSKYSVSNKLLNAEMSAVFHKPEMIETTSEKIANAKAKLELGITDRVQILMDLDEISQEEAEKRIAEIDERKQAQLRSMIDEQEENIGRGSEPNNRPDGAPEGGSEEQADS